MVSQPEARLKQVTMGEFASKVRGRSHSEVAEVPHSDDAADIFRPASKRQGLSVSAMEKVTDVLPSEASEDVFIEVDPQVEETWWTQSGNGVQGGCQGCARRWSGTTRIIPGW